MNECVNVRKIGIPPSLSKNKNFSVGFSFCPFGFSYIMYLFLLTPPLITNVTPLRVPLGASLRPNLRPPGKFPLMLTIGGKNNMSPAHRDKVFWRIRQSWNFVLSSEQKFKDLVLGFKYALNLLLHKQCKNNKFCPVSLLIVRSQ